MNIKEFIEEIKKLNIDIDSDKMEKLQIYSNFLIEYNKHTNLTAIKEEKDIYLKHFYDSLTIVKIIDLNKCNNLIDIGTGAGFPGMVLKIFYPNLDVTLLDSNNKKTKFLKELSQNLNLDVDIVNERVEIFSKNNLNKYDIVTSRAVANLRVLSELCLPLVKENGYFIPLKSNVLEEMKESLDTIKMMDGDLEKRVEFNLFNNNGLRNILLIKKIRNTDIDKIRTYDKILKKPLKNNNK